MVARLSEFLPTYWANVRLHIGRLFTLGGFLHIEEVAQILWPLI
jgi:hypothetical protein